MRITLNIARPEVEEPDLLSLEIFPDMSLGTLRESIQAETHIPKAAQHLYHNGRLITDDTKSMQQLQIGDGEMLAMHVRDMSVTTAGGNAPAGQAASGRRRQAAGSGQQDDPEMIRLRILGDPGLRAQAQSQMPELISALEDPQRFAQVLQESAERERNARLARRREIDQLNNDMFDIEAQRRIEEMIRQERVMENLQDAVEYSPEVFGRVHLLYIDVEVNGHNVKALVDSGAQATIMSPSCAEACGIMRLVDTRFAGMARGVGTANILGRVHYAQIKIGTLFLPCSFTVMEGKSVELLLGLDMLKRHQATLDLARDRLIIQGTEVSFLGEADIPKDLEQAYQQEPTVPGPGGTTIGQRTGAVSGPDGPAANPFAAPTTTPTATPQAAPAPASVPTAAQSATPSFPDTHVQQLMDLGVSREQAINALQATGGNVEYAAVLLFQG